jgi:ketosteroid isomerase-like protein
MTESTAAAVDAYYARWRAGDFDALRRLLTADFAFRGPMDRADGPAAFIDLISRNASAFSGATFSDVRRVVDGDRAVSLYTFELGGARVPMAEAFEVRNSQIARVDLFFDPAQLRPPTSGDA